MRLISFTISLLLTITAQAVELKFPADSKYLLPGGDILKFANNDKNLELKDGGSVIILVNDSIPVLVHHSKNSNAKIEINPADLKKITDQFLAPQLNTALNEIAKAQVEIQGLIQKRNLNVALTKVNQLKEKYNGVALILFLEGTVHYLLNNKQLATSALEQGLVIDPNNSDAKSLLSKLKGGS